MDFTVLLDAPATTAARVQVAQLGQFKDGRYGEFEITRADVASWQKNLAKLPGGRALIDLDHRADRSPRNTEAAGWITGVHMDGDTPVATVEWTPVGKAAIEEKRYLFFSPTYGEFTDETGETHDNTLVGGALTNKPFLSRMPAISLASQERLATLQAGDDNLQALVDALRSGLVPAPRTGSDSRPAMTPELLTLLGLAENAEDSAVLDAIRTLQTDAAKVTQLEQPRSLELQAADAGKILLDSAKYAELAAGTKAGSDALKQLAQSRFDNAFTDAVRSGRAVDAERDSFHTFFQLDADTTIKTLAERPQIVNVKPSSWDNSALQNGDAPVGIEPESHQLDQKVKTRLRELGKPMSDYTVVFEQMMSEGAL